MSTLVMARTIANQGVMTMSTTMVKKLKMIKIILDAGM